MLVRAYVCVVVCVHADQRACTYFVCVCVCVCVFCFVLFFCCCCCCCFVLVSLTTMVSSYPFFRSPQSHTAVICMQPVAKGHRIEVGSAGYYPH